MRFRSRLSVGFAVAVTGLAAVAVIVPQMGTGGAAAAAATQASAAAAVVPYAPYPATGTELYVDSTLSAFCSDSGAGTQGQPFCTIAAAASAVQPGQTVVVEPGTYAATTISVQGIADAPVTFTAIKGASVNGPFTVSGAHDVVLNGFSVMPSAAQQEAFDVTGGSSGVTINGGYAMAGSQNGAVQVPAIEIDGTSSDVTVSRMAVDGHKDIQVDPGASGVVITGNTLESLPGGTGGVLVTDAPGTDVTGNTLHDICSGGIALAGASSGATVENNIVQPVASTVSGCAAGTAISVSAASEAGTVVGYNLIDPSAGGPLYDWGGTSYASLAGFQAASGQGAHDIAANPGFGSKPTEVGLMQFQNVFWLPLSASSPAVDSADANAPGELPTDQFGNPRTDDPSVPDSGTGAGYYDRGAVELEGGLSTPGAAHVSVARSGPLTATFTLGDKPVWTTNGPLVVMELGFGDGGTPMVITRATSVRHTYRTAGPYTIGYTGDGGQLESAQLQVVVGADYTPVTPARILDTRNGAGTGKAAPVAAGGTLTLPIASIGGVPAADISAVVMNVTVTSPARSGNLTVFPGSGTVPLVSNLNFSAGETVPNLVTVQLAGGEVSFHNNSGGTVQVVADLEGFYGPGGSGFQPTAPVRVLDTRVGTGASKAPVAAGGVLRLDLSGKVPTGTAAVVMNVTVTQPKKSGYLTVYPDGMARPDASNLNFSAGETVPNLVMVPLVGGVADIANTSGGTVQVVADLAGYFAAGAPDAFVPLGPAREVDTRFYSPLTPHETYTVNILTECSSAGVCTSGTQDADAMVDNVTVTAPARNGVLTVYPAGQPRPLASNLNFLARETVPNLAIVQGGNGQVSFYNDSGGQLQLIIDEYGYFMAAS